MVFSSMIFLWVFLPLVLIVNRLIPTRMKNVFLLFASLVFITWGGWNSLFTMLLSITINYFGGRLIDRFENRKKLVLVGTVVLDIALLVVFKYFNFIVVIIESIMEQNWGGMLALEGSGKLGFKEIVLPIGISFFTFQAMSYVVDVYKGKAKVQKNFVEFALYVALFPQLIAGPIVIYSDVAAQIKSRRETSELFVEGIKRFCYGLGKKVLLSNVFAELADEIWKLEINSIGAPIAWLGLIAYTLQIYFDFSGYSDMAIGIGKMLGFNFKENFNYPYTSLSIQDFWRRWHISLSSWFKEYVYIPLGGNRKGRFRTYLNLFIVFFLTGVWHGANFTFLIWGLIYAALLILERAFLGKLLDRNPVKIINWIYVMFFVMIAWVFFRSNNVVQAWEFVKQLFSGASGTYSILSYLTMKRIVCFVLGILFCGVIQRILAKFYDKIKSNKFVNGADFVIQMLLLVCSIVSIVSGTYNPFIYFQF